MVVFQINDPATDHIYLLLTGDERQRQGVRVIMACFYWLVGANRNSLQAAPELISSSTTDNHRSRVQVDVFQMPSRTLLQLVSVWAARARNWAICICCCLDGEALVEHKSEGWRGGRNSDRGMRMTKNDTWRKGASASKVLQGRHEDRESGNKSKSERGRYQSVLFPECPSVFWFIQTLRGSPGIKQHTFNPRLAVPQPERTSELVTLACYERPSTPPQSPLSRGSLDSSNGKHCCGTLTSQRQPASWQNGFKSLISARTLIMQYV